MKKSTSKLFCLDFDETLFQTDKLRLDLANSITQQLGADASQQYLELYEEIRLRMGGVSIPLVFHELRVRNIINQSEHTQLAQLIHNFPYQQYLYPDAETVIAHLKKLGTTILFSDGDEFFQTLKIYATSIAALVDHIVILPNKVKYFSHLEGFYPVDEYVFIDDKARVLDEAQRHFNNQSTTVHIRQGRYATTNPELKPSFSVGSLAEILKTF